jgi:hypothetical protein
MTISGNKEFYRLAPTHERKIILTIGVGLEDFWALRILQFIIASLPPVS